MSTDFWAGYISGAAGIAIGNPLDIIKVKLQTGSYNATTNATTNGDGTTRRPFSTWAKGKVLETIPITTIQRAITDEFMAG